MLPTVVLPGIVGSEASSSLSPPASPPRRCRMRGSSILMGFGGRPTVKAEYFCARGWTDFW